MLDRCTSNRRQAHTGQRVAQSVAVVSECSGVDDDSVICSDGFVNQIDQRTLVVALVKADFDTVFYRHRLKVFFNVFQGRFPVYFRLTSSQKVQIRVR